MSASGPSGGTAGGRDPAQKESARAAERDRPDVAAQRVAGPSWQDGLDPGRPVLLDETWAKSSVTPPRRWGPIGRRGVESVPHRHRKAAALPAPPRATGPVAPLAIDGAMSGELSRAYVRQHRAPARRPGDLAAMDDPPSHEVAGVAEAARGAGAGLASRPPSSPDLNPAEPVLPEAGAEIRRQEPRPVGATEAVRGEAIDWFPSNECRRHIRHAGDGPRGAR